MATLTKEQIDAKKQQVEQLNDEELGQATGGSRNPVNDDELDEASGGSMSVSHQQYIML